jgi:cytochrome c oxidase subunit I+III
MLVLVAVAASVFGCVAMAYLYLLTVSPATWPAASGDPFASPAWPFAAAALLVLSGVALAVATHAQRARVRGRLLGGLLLAAALLVVALAMEAGAHWRTGLRPAESAYAATVYALVALQAFHVCVLVLMALYAGARELAGKLSAERRGCFDNMLPLWAFTIVQGLLALALVHGAPWLAGP